MDQPTSLAVVASLSAYSLHRQFHIPAASFLLPPLLSLPFQSSVSSYVLFVTLYGLALLLLVILYRSFRHPLNRFPGPLAARFTNFWRLTTLWKGENYQLVRSLHEQYGDYVRIGPEELSVRDASAIPTVYNSPSWTKAEFYATVSDLQGPLSSLQSERDYKEHARRRKTWDVAFSRPALARYQHIVTGAADSMCEAILRRSKGDEGVDLRREVMYFTWTVMHKIGFGGHGLDMIETGPCEASESIFITMKGLLRMLTVLSATAWLTPFAAKLPPDPNVVKFLKLSRSSMTNVQLTRECLVMCLRFWWLSPLHEPGLSTAEREKLELEAEADSQLLIVAGSDTTASAITWIWFYLLSEPGKVTYFELRKQLDVAFKDDHEIDSAELVRRVPLLEHVINEVLRLRPPVPVGPLQRAAPAGGAFVGTSQQFIPAGAMITIPQVALSYDAKLFEDPYKFKPERWASSDVSRAGFMPFSVGPYACVGKQVAMQEMRHITAVLLRRLDMEFPAGFDAEWFCENAWKDFGTGSTLEPMPVIITERKTSSV